MKRNRKDPQPSGEEVEDLRYFFKGDSRLHEVKIFDLWKCIMCVPSRCPNFLVPPFFGSAYKHKAYSVPLSIPNAHLTLKEPGPLKRSARKL